MIKAYYRPHSVGQALELLSRDGIKTVVLTGQSTVDAGIDDSVDEVVDLQAVGLNEVRTASSKWVVEALVSLQEWMEYPALPDALREIIRAEDSHTFRNMRTIGSLLAKPSAESQLIAALLACDAVVTLETYSGSRQVALTEFVRNPAVFLSNGLVTAVTLDVGGQISAAHVSRTPADRPIVAAVARKTFDGQVRLALSGVALSPIRVELAAVEQVQPFSDFRGSADYRRAMAVTLSQRVVDVLR